MERAFKNAGKAGSGFGRTMRGVGKVAAGGFAAAIVGVGFALKRGFSELAESQKIAAQTGAVLRSTGGIANVTGKQVDKLATSISRKSGIDDEAIASSENLLLTFTRIRNAAGKGNKIFDRATQAVVDMSVAMGRDLGSTAIMVGKALNDMVVTTAGNVRGFMALRRVGVQITPQVMKMAAAMVESGNVMGAQKILLRELATEFGGSARAFGSTMPGALGKLRNAFDEVAAAFASGFLPLILKVAKVLTTKLADPAFVARVRELGTLVGTKLYNAFAAIGNWFKENWPAIKSGFQTAGNLARRMYGWVQKLAKVTPGGEGTLIGLFVGGILVSKMLAVARALRLINTRLVIMAIRFAPIVAGIMALQKFREEGLGTERWQGGWKGAIPGYGWLFGGDKKAPPKMGKPPRIPQAPGALRPRALGGPVMPGVSYRVGERGPEMFVPNMGGSIVAGGRGGVLVTGDITLKLDKRTVAVVTLRELQRMAKSNSSQRGGRYGGANLGIT